MSTLSTHQGHRVVVLEKLDGAPSNVAIIVEGPDSGSIIYKQDGKPPNCNMKQLSFILTNNENEYKTYDEMVERERAMGGKVDYCKSN